MNEEYQEIDLIDLVKRVLSRWWLIVLLVGLSGTVAYVTTKQFMTPIYEASTTIFIGKDTSSLGGIDVLDLQTGYDLLNDYKELIRTNLVTNEVISELGLMTDPMSLSSALSVDSVGESRFMTITFSDSDPKIAKQVADKISVILTEKAGEIVGIKNIQIVDYAVLPTAAVGPSAKRNVAVAGMLGMMAALFIIFIEMMLDNSIKKAEDIEKTLGLPLLGSIPKFEGGGRR